MLPLYFDPGTGALIVQFFAAAIGGMLLFYKTVLQTVKSMFGVKDKKSDDFMDEQDNLEVKE